MDLNIMYLLMSFLRIYAVNRFWSLKSGMTIIQIFCLIKRNLNNTVPLVTNTEFN